MGDADHEKGRRRPCAVAQSEVRSLAGAHDRIDRSASLRTDESYGDQAQPRNRVMLAVDELAGRARGACAFLSEQAPMLAPGRVTGPDERERSRRRRRGYARFPRRATEP